MSGIYGYPTDPAQSTGTVGTSAGEGGTVITEDAVAVKALNNAMRGIAGDLGNFRNDISAANSTASASGTAYVLSTSSQITALADGIRLTWLPDADNTGAATLNVDTLGAKKLLHDSAVLAAGEIKSGHPVDCVYDASADSAAGAWLVLNPVVTAGTYTSDDIGDDSDYSEASVTAALNQAKSDIETNASAITGKANTSHTHNASDINAGTLDAARIPTLAQSKITNLTTDLASKYSASNPPPASSPPSTYGAVGTYVMAFIEGGGSASPGGTISASNLNGVSSGTWRCMTGYSLSNGQTGVFLRIS